MRYEKPAVMELNARTVSGQDPLACIPGNGVVPIGCNPGSYDASCYPGTVGYQFADDCIPGTGAGAGFSCLVGNGAGWECAGGIAPEFPGACTAGPSIAL